MHVSTIKHHLSHFSSRSIWKLLPFSAPLYSEIMKWSWMDFIRVFDCCVLIGIWIDAIKILLFGIKELGKCSYDETNDRISIKILEETNAFQNKFMREKWWTSMYISVRTEYLRDRKLIVSISHISAKSHLCNCLVKRIRKLIVKSNWRGKINNIRISGD